MWRLCYFREKQLALKLQNYNRKRKGNLQSNSTFSSSPVKQAKKRVGSTFFSIINIYYLINKIKHIDIFY